MTDVDDTDDLGLFVTTHAQAKSLLHKWCQLMPNKGMSLIK